MIVHVLGVARLLECLYSGQVVIPNLVIVLGVHLPIVLEYELLHVLDGVLSLKVGQLAVVEQDQRRNAIDLDEVGNVVLSDGVFQVVLGVSPVDLQLRLEVSQLDYTPLAVVAVEVHEEAVLFSYIRQVVVPQRGEHRGVVILFPVHILDIRLLLPLQNTLDPLGDVYIKVTVLLDEMKSGWYLVRFYPNYR